MNYGRGTAPVPARYAPGLAGLVHVAMSPLALSAFSLPTHHSTLPLAPRSHYAITLIGNHPPYALHGRFDPQSSPVAEVNYREGGSETTGTKQRYASDASDTSIHGAG